MNSINLANCALLSSIDFSTLPNAAAGAAGSTTAWGSAWIDVDGGTLSVSAGRGIINAISGEYPETLHAAHPSNVLNPLLVVKGRFTDATSAGAGDLLSFMSRYTSATANDFWQIQPWSNTQFDTKGTNLSESQPTLPGVTSAGGTDFLFVYGEQVQSTTYSTIIRRIYAASDTNLTTPLLVQDATGSLSSIQATGQVGFSGYYSGSFQFSSIALYDQGYGVPAIAPQPPRTQRSSIVVPSLYLYPSRPTGTYSYVGSNTVATSRVRFTAMTDLCNPRVQYQAIAAFNSALANGLSITASLEFPAGNTRTPIFFEGDRTLAMGAGGISSPSDPAPAFIPKGSQYWIWTAATIPSGGAVPFTYETTNGLLDGYIEDTDVTLVGSVNSDYSNRFGPSAVWGDVSAASPIVALIGDSIGRGQGTNYGAWFTLAMAAAGKWGYLNQAMPGAYFSQFGDYSTCSIGSHVVIALGTNDFAGGTSAALVQWYAQLAVAYFESFGIPVYLTTVMPCGVASTDGYVTLANQTINGNNAARETYNTYLRGGGPSGVAGIIDLAAQIEDPNNPGKFRVDLGALTADGTHLNDAGASLAANAATTTLSQMNVVAGRGAVYSNGGTAGF